MTRRRAWCWLAILLGVAALYAACWANWTWSYTHDRYQQLPPGASSRVNLGYELRVTSISRTRPDEVTSYDEPIPGTVLITVVFEARVVGTHPDDDLFCSHPLVAAGRQWDTSNPSYNDDRPTECEPDDLPMDATWREYTAGYTIPEQYADQVQGVVVFHYNGTPGEVLRP